MGGAKAKEAMGKSRTLCLKVGDSNTVFFHQRGTVPDAKVTRLGAILRIEEPQGQDGNSLTLFGQKLLIVTEVYIITCKLMNKHNILKPQPHSFTISFQFNQNNLNQ